MFVTEGRKDLSLLHAALGKDDRETVRDILHKNLPLWDALCLDFPVEELRRITTMPPGSWKSEDLAGIREIEKAADRLLRYAMDMQKRKNEKDTDHRGRRGLRPEYRQLAEEAGNGMPSCDGHLPRARKSLASEEFDLVLADLRLPDGNSTELPTLDAREMPCRPVSDHDELRIVDNAVEARQLER